MLIMDNCTEKISKKLAILPPSMREGLVKTICDAFKDRDLNCDDCEIVKIISPFYIDQDGICVSFRDENNEYSTSCFGINDILTQLTMDVSPGCLMEQEEWNALSFPDRVQAIMNYRCTCGE
jgi:hypothetical protein